MMWAAVNRSKVDKIAAEFVAEMLKATEKFPSITTEHEGYAIILEEMEEMWENIKLNQYKHEDRKKMIRKEAIQVGAMVLRLIYDLL